MLAADQSLWKLAGRVTPADLTLVQKSVVQTGRYSSRTVHVCTFEAAFDGQDKNDISCVLCTFPKRDTKPRPFALF